MSLTLLEELRSDQDPRSQCAFCAWLRVRSKAEQTEWAEAMTDRSFTTTSLVRAARKREFTRGSAIESHRKNGHTL